MTKLLALYYSSQHFGTKRKAILINIPLAKYVDNSSCQMLRTAYMSNGKWFSKRFIIISKAVRRMIHFRTKDRLILHHALLKKRYLKITKCIILWVFSLFKIAPGIYTHGKNIPCKNFLIIYFTFAKSCYYKS